MKQQVHIIKLLSSNLKLQIEPFIPSTLCMHRIRKKSTCTLLCILGLCKLVMHIYSYPLVKCLFYASLQSSSAAVSSLNAVYTPFCAHMQLRLKQ